MATKTRKTTKKAPAKKKKISGKTFSLKMAVKTVGPARKFAEKQRAEGKNARVVKAPSGGYGVYTHSKQRSLSSYGRTVLKKSSKQTGKSCSKQDKKRKAMAPGYRRSASGKLYYEGRKNHSDLKGKV